MDADYEKQRHLAVIANRSGFGEFRDVPVVPQRRYVDLSPEERATIDHQNQISMTIVQNFDLAEG